MQPKKFIPRGEFQEEGTRFIIENLRTNIHCDMGLGKTSITLNAIDALMRLDEIKITLVIAPLRVARSTWADECKKWTHLSHLTVSPIVGNPKQRAEALKKKADIYTINYENLPALVEYLDGKWPFRMVVADESTKLKSHRAHYRRKKDGTQSLVCTGGVRTSAIARLSFKKTERWVNLTGTPAPNGLIDLWGQCWFVDGGASLGRSFSDFQDSWFRVGYNGYDLEPLPYAEKEILEAIRPYTFTLRAEDYLDLGEEVVNTIYVDLPTVAQRKYADMERDYFVTVQEHGIEAFSAAAKSAKLHQIANGAIYYETGEWVHVHDAKIEALQSVIEEANGTPVIVVYKFQSDLMRLKKAFPKGVQLKNKKDEDNFKAGKIPILFIHPDSAGHGIDGFQYVTNILCLFSVDWNLETRLQTIARIGKVRQFQAGLNRPAIIHQIVARNTIDEDILARIEQKITIEEALKAGLARRGLK